MNHVYLTETEIKAALKARAITEREAKELAHTLKTIQHKQQKEGRQQRRLAS